MKNSKIIAKCKTAALDLFFYLLCKIKEDNID